jgi:hypothetical protein
MPDVYLGVDISSAVKLPRLRWFAGNRPSIPIEFPAQIEYTTMSDGTLKANIKETMLRTWPLSWEALTSAELAPLKALNALRQELVFQYGWDDTNWYYVTIDGFKYEPLVYVGPTPLYSVSFSVRQMR